MFSVPQTIYFKTANVTVTIRVRYLSQPKSKPEPGSCTQIGTRESYSPLLCIRLGKSTSYTRVYTMQYRMLYNNIGSRGMNVCFMRPGKCTLFLKWRPKFPLCLGFPGYFSLA